MPRSAISELPYARKPRVIPWKQAVSTGTGETTILNGATYNRAVMCAIMASNSGAAEHRVSIYIGTGNQSDADDAIDIYIPPLGGVVFFNLTQCERQYDASEGIFFKRITAGTATIIVNIGYIDLTD